MSATNRAKLITKLQTALKKHYDVPPATPSRPLLEHALYACLLEDCPADLADEGLAKLEQDYFDWNEVRVTTVTELAGVLSSLPDANKAAQRLKSILQAIFEEFYSFDLDHLKKENLGKAVAKFEGMEPMTPFVLSYIIQHGLGGHSIPIDYSAMVVMLVTGIASQSEAADGRVPGLERAVPKSKGVEFAALLHQPAVALTINPKDKTARSFLEAVVKGSSKELDEWLSSKEAAIQRVKARKKEEREAAKQEAEAEAAAEEAQTKSAVLVKRSAKKGSRTTKPAVPQKSAAEQAAESKARLEAEAKKAEAKSAGTKTKKKATKSTSDSSEKKEAATPKKSSKTASKSSTTTKSAGKKSSKTSAAKKAPAKKSSGNAKASTAKPAAPKKAAKKKAAPKKSSSSGASSSSAGKKATNRKLTKRKPR